MSKQVLVLLVAGAVAVMALAHAATSASTRVLGVVDVETNAAAEPLGIDDATPRLTWAIETDRRGVEQKAFRLLVATSPKLLHEGRTDVLDTKNVQTSNPWYEYAGPALEPRTRYYWAVRVLATGGTQSQYSEPTWFETAYLSQDAWQGQWISGPQRLEVPRSAAQGTADDACCLPYTNLALGAAAGDASLKVVSVAGFAAGATVDVDTGAARETATVSAVGTAASISSLAAPAAAGDANLKLASVAGHTAGGTIAVDTGAGLEQRTVATVGTAAGAANTLFAPASAGDTNVKVSGVGGFAVGQELLVGTERRTVTAVGTQGRSTTTVAPVAAGATNVKLASVTGLVAGDPLTIDGETRTIQTVGTAAGGATILFAAAAAGDTNVKVTSANGFVVGDPILVDTGSALESRTITAVGTQGRITSLAAPAAAGDTVIRVASVTGLLAGDTLILDTGTKQETRTIAAVGTAGAAGTGLTLTSGLARAHSTGQVWDPGTGITFAPGLGSAHLVQATARGAGTGVTLTTPLGAAHAHGAAATVPGTGIDLTPAALGSAAPAGATARGLGTGISLTAPLASAHALGARTTAPGTGVTLAAPLGSAHPATALVAKPGGDYCRLPGSGNTSGACRELRPAPLLRKSFEVTKQVAKARLYAAGLAYNEMTLNGDRTADTALDTAFTNYADTVLYSTHDVTGLIHQGANVLATTLGSGQFDDEVTSNDWHWEDAEWRSTPQVIADLRITYADGTEQVVKTDDSWKAALGPIRYDNYYGGETYDATKELPGWNLPAFDASSWAAARTVPAPTNKAVAGSPPALLQAQKVEATKVVGNWPAGTRTEPLPGIVVYDTGQQRAGWATISVAGARAGTPIQIHYGEKLNANGTTSNSGFTAQTQVQTDIYVAKGTGTAANPEVYEPQFTYKGFQYVQISSPSNPAAQAGGTPQPLPDGVTVAVRSVQEVRTPMPRTGTFASSSPVLDLIERNTRAALAENYVSGIITDTPIYEKNAWTGDAQLSAPTASLMFDTELQYWKNFRDLVDNQAPGLVGGATVDGEVTLLAPTNDGYGHVGQTFKAASNSGATPIWDAFWFVIPWESYLRYGDLRGIELTYPLMVKYLDDWIPAWAARDGDSYAYTLTSGLGDWDPPTGAEVNGIGPTGLNLNNINRAISPASTAYYAYMARIAADSARALGRTAEAAHFDDVFAKVKADFNDRWWDDELGYYTESRSVVFTQVAQVLPLAFGLVPDDRRAALQQRLVHDVMVTRAGHELVGIAGSRWILMVLSDAAYEGVPGAAQAAYTIALQTTYPSYGYWGVVLGWTSLGEFWEASSRTRTHHMFGAIGQWLYENLAGLQPLEPGYRKIAFRPTIADGLDHASASYDSVRGRIVSEWRKAGSTLQLDVTVPPNATGLVYVPGTDPNAVTEVGTGKSVLARKADGVDLVGVQGSHVVFSVGSGSYEFRSPAP